MPDDFRLEDLTGFVEIRILLPEGHWEDAYRILLRHSCSAALLNFRY